MSKISLKTFLLNIFNFRFQVVIKKKKFTSNASEANKSHKLSTIEQQAQDLLEMKNYQLFFDMMAHGYIPTQPQIKTLSDTFMTAIKKHGEEKKSIIELFMKNNYSLQDEDVISLLFETHLATEFAGILKNWNEEQFQRLPSTRSYLTGEFKSLYPTVAQVQQRVQEAAMLKKAFEHWMDLFRMGQLFFFERSIKGVYELLKDEFMNHVSIEHMKEIAQAMEKFSSQRYSNMSSTVMHDFMQQLNEDFTKYNSLQVKTLLSQTKQAYIGNNIERLTTSVCHEKIQQLHLNALPPQVRQQVQHIQQQYQKINLNLLTMEQQLRVENMMEKNLPHVISMYMMIDEEYLKIFQAKEENSPQQLLCSSLESIAQGLNEIVQQINEDRLKQLTVKTKYIQSSSRG